MALEKTLVEKKEHFDGQLKVENAYWKVEQVIVSKTNGIAVVSASRIKNDVKYQLTSKQYSFIPELNSVNFIQQAYDYLKTLPEFAGAQDC